MEEEKEIMLARAINRYTATTLYLSGEMDKFISGHKGNKRDIVKCINELALKFEKRDREIKYLL